MSMAFPLLPLLGGAIFAWQERVGVHYSSSPGREMVTAVRQSKEDRKEILLVI
jgi:hypothetical protein